MFVKPVRALSTAIALTVLATVVPALSAGAIDGGCSISVPSKVRVNAPYERITGNLQSDCANSMTDYASWDVYHPREGWTSIFIFDGSSADDWDWYSWDGLGTFEVRAGSAWDSGYNDLPQNSGTVSVKLASRLALATSRSGSYVTLKATATRYSTSADKYRAWAGTTVRLYYRNRSSDPWIKIAARTTNSDGKVSYKWRKSNTRTYKAVTVDSSNTFGRTSSTSRR